MPKDDLNFVLAIAGHDPSGAGIHADIETCAALSCGVFTVITALTVQNTAEVRAIHPTEPDVLAEQLRCINDDSRDIHACKIGLVPNRAILAVIVEFLQTELSEVPVVFDPVLKAGVGTRLADIDLAEAAREALLPLTTVCTPNQAEALMLSGAEDYQNAGMRLNRSGCPHVLITGTDHDDNVEVMHRLFEDEQLAETYTCRRLPGHFHGSGCTLSSAIAAELACGNGLRAAIEAAQAFTWVALDASTESGHQQRLPRRVR